MKHRIHSHPDMQRRYGIPEDHVVIDTGLYQALILTFGSHFDDSAIHLSQGLLMESLLQFQVEIQQALTKIQLAIHQYSNPKET